MSASVGILGAGRAGTALARALTRAQVPVRIAATRPRAALRLHLAQYAPGATAVPATEVAQGAELVVLMVPQEELDTVDPAWVQDRVLVDATNRWEDEPLPGWLEEPVRAGVSSSQALAERFAGSTVVKALNHLSHHDLDRAAPARLQPVHGGHRVGPEEAAVPVGGAPAPDSPSTRAASPAVPRRALAVATDDPAARLQVAGLIQRLGFDPVLLADLEAGRVLEPGGPVFLRAWTGPELATATGGVLHHGR